MLFDAHQLARGWLSVALAAAPAKQGPPFGASILIEEHLHGVRLAATDTAVLLHCWVPELHHESDPPPEIDEAPTSTATVIDAEGRGKGLLAHALKVANTAERDGVGPVEVRLRLRVPPSASSQGQLVGMEAHQVVIEIPEEERLQLDTYDGPPLPWRVSLSHAPAATDRVVLNPEILGRLGKLRTILPNAGLRWTWSGTDTAAQVEAIDSDPWVTGVVMPALDPHARPRAAGPELDGQEPLDEAFAEDVARALDQIDDLP